MGIAVATRPTQKFQSCRYLFLKTDRSNDVEMCAENKAHPEPPCVRLLDRYCGDVVKIYSHFIRRILAVAIFFRKVPLPTISGFYRRQNLF